MEGLIGKVFGSFAKTIGVSLPIALLMSAPALIYTAITFSNITLESAINLESTVRTYTIVVLALTLLLTPIATGAITYAAVQTESGAQLTAGKALAAGFARLVPVLGTALLTGLAILGGFIMLIIPGVIAAIRLSAAPAVTVVERLGPVAALKRSWELTKPYGGQIFGAYFLVGILGRGAHWMAEKALIPNQNSDFEAILSGFKATLYVGWAIDVVASALTAVLAANVYIVARRAKDGVDPAQLAATFD